MVILIVTTAGMVSTTWVQFIKGSLLVIFCAMLTIAILGRGSGVTMPDPPTTPILARRSEGHSPHGACR